MLRVLLLSHGDDTVAAANHLDNGVKGEDVWAVLAGQLFLGDCLILLVLYTSSVFCSGSLDTFHSLGGCSSCSCCTRHRCSVATLRMRSFCAVPMDVFLMSVLLQLTIFLGLFMTMTRQQTTIQLAKHSPSFSYQNLLQALLSS